MQSSIQGGVSGRARRRLAGRRKENGANGVMREFRKFPSYRKDGAGDGTQTRDVQLGKMTVD